MNSLTTWRVYAALIGLLVLELLCARSSLALKNWLVASAAVAQFSLLLLVYLGIGRTRGWVKLFGCLYLLWLAVMFVFVLGEAATR
ncbi:MULTISPECIES: hypothetical protein [unclassified Pseudomonas]|uniref:hypothetical protein n=1 Tax=unclassified Pseudomonas TaxID=196821 RepID=UPI002AC94B90|nr:MULTISPECIES: hypothetical protein [unclassified Pseudomonas]MEB0040031.1 hypothetical protein [Pseudomonas sp. MH10]MEB0119556.1 hypothetical protein [Pseudomonas sp. CCI1.2]WPX65161.1 hypothetical protein RHM59_05665 [Pseudomonas sp. MH10]